MHQLVLNFFSIRSPKDLLISVRYCYIQALTTRARFILTLIQRVFFVKWDLCKKELKMHRRKVWYKPNKCFPQDTLHHFLFMQFALVYFIIPWTAQLAVGLQSQVIQSYPHKKLWKNFHNQWGESLCPICWKVLKKFDLCFAVFFFLFCRTSFLFFYTTWTSNTSAVFSPQILFFGTIPLGVYKYQKLQCCGMLHF